MTRYLEQAVWIRPRCTRRWRRRCARHLVPVCFTSARSGAGCRPAGVLVRHLPHPGEGNPPLFSPEPAGRALVPFQPDPSRHVLAHVFKIVNDPYIGRIGTFRVHQGTITRDTQLYVARARRRSRSPTRC